MKGIALTVVLIASAAGLAACGPSSDTKGTDRTTASKDTTAKGTNMPGMDMKSTDKGQNTVHQAVGIVKNIDPAKSTVTLDHEAVKTLNWPAMTMSFAVRDKTILDKLQPGTKVGFEFVQEGKENVITAVK
jgi:Cu(I)/Ag(I) efflux system protein CusF